MGEFIGIAEANVKAAFGGWPLSHGTQHCVARNRQFRPALQTGLISQALVMKGALKLRSKKEPLSFENGSEVKLGNLQPCVLPLPCLQPYVVRMVYVGVIRL